MRIRVMIFCLLTTLNSFAELGPKIRKPAKSAVPKVDKLVGVKGYSKHHGAHENAREGNSGTGTSHSFVKSRDKKNEHNGYSHSLRSSTFGIVTSLRGKVYCIHQNGKLILPVKKGDGILKNDVLWVEGGTLIQVASTSGSMLSVAGPAAVGFHRPDHVKMYRGTLRVKTSKKNAYYFSSVFLNSKILPDSDSAFWVSPNKSQAVSFQGKVQAWHPELKDQVVELPAHFFTEHELEKNYLQPRFPELSSEESMQIFAEKFKDVNPSIDFKAQVRKIASVVTGVFKGSRTKSELVEIANQDYELRLKAHITGKNWPERREVAEVKASSTVSSYSSEKGPLQGNHRGPASVPEVSSRGMNPQTEALIRKFVNSQ